MAEICVAKNMYVETKSGWFSDRTICYLASGKPVLHQDTGPQASLSDAAKGLIVFSTLDEAVGGGGGDLGETTSATRRQRARLAEEYFDSDKVLTRLLEKLGVG